MFLKRKLFSLLVLLSPLWSFSSYGMSIDELKKQCLEFKQNDQIEPFKIKVECSGSFTYWEKEEGNVTLQNSSKMFTQTSTKCGRYQTEESMFEKSINPQDVACLILTKKEVSTPDGFGIPLMVGSCEELTVKNIEQLCRGKVSEYCQDNMIGRSDSLSSHSSSSHSSTSSSSSSDHEPCKGSSSGLCTLRDVDRIDTCELFSK